MPDTAAPHGSHPKSPVERALQRYAALAARRPFAVTAALLALGAACAAYGSGIRIRQNMEDLFPESTPAVVEARRARTIMPSSSQMIVIFGSPDQQANRRLATAFCAKAEAMPEMSSVECRRDVDFFKRNAALYLPVDELEEIERDTRQRVRDATRKDMLGAALTEGLEDAPGQPVAGVADGEDDDEGFDDDERFDLDDDKNSAKDSANDDANDNAKDDFDDDDEDFGSTDPAAAPASAAAPGAPPGGAPKAAQAGAAPGTQPAKPSAGRAARGGKRLPSDEELRQRLGAREDLREWAESPDGKVLGVKLFPTVPANKVDESAAFVAKVERTISELKPTSFHPEMQVAYRGSYAEMTKEVDHIRRGLAVTTSLALLGIALIQLLAFRRFRALVLLFGPLLLGIAFTMAFARGAVGYLNLITAFIFGILFGLGNDFGVYTLSRYQEERASGRTAEEAVVLAVPGLWQALRTAALTTTAAFLSLTVFEFRGFSQFGLIAGAGVVLALTATLLLFPALAVALDRVVAEPPVRPGSAQGIRLFGLFARPRVARVAVVVLLVAAVVGAWLGQGLTFDTNFRKLRTPASKSPSAKASAKQRLGNAYRNQAEKRSASPILVITDSLADSRVVHDQLAAMKGQASRLAHFVSIHSFVPEAQATKLPVIRRIRATLEAKRDLLTGDDRAEADRALTMLPAQTFGPAALPDFVRKRFLDVDGKLGRYVLIYANGNLADARSVQEVIDQVGRFSVGDKRYRATASFFILAEADQIVRKEGPLAVLLAALAVLLVIGLHYRSWRMVAYSFVPLALAFAVFLGVAAVGGLQLNLFSISVLPSIFGIGIDGTVHIVHRAWEVGPEGDLALVLQQIGGAAWVAAVTTVVGFGALLFQDNPGLQTIASMAVVGILVVCTLANVFAGALLAVAPVPGATPGGQNR